MCYMPLICAYVVLQLQEAHFDPLALMRADDDGMAQPL